MSISSAVHMAPLYTRTLYHAMDGSTGWDGSAGDLSVAWDDLQYWADHLTVSTGKTWIKRLHICGDASCGGYGAYMPNDVLTGDCLGGCTKIVHCFLFCQMGGTLDVFPEITRLYLFAAHHDVHVDFIWKPKESPEMLIADKLSREDDSSEIFVTRKTFHSIGFPQAGSSALGHAHSGCFCWGCNWAA